jgi:nucleotide-binding universal stress UspA family protein
MKVLMPLDGSEFASSVLPAARRLLELVPGTEVHLLTVLDPRTVQGSAESVVNEPLQVGSYNVSVSSPPPHVVESHGEAMERAHTETVDWLDAMVSKEFPEAASVVRVVWSRKPVDQIIAVADEIDADLILMPTHGRSGLSHLLAGSVTEGVIRTAGRPILVVGPSRER